MKYKDKAPTDLSTESTKEPLMGERSINYLADGNEFDSFIGGNPVLLGKVGGYALILGNLSRFAIVGGTTTRRAGVP